MSSASRVRFSSSDTNKIKNLAEFIDEEIPKTVEFRAEDIPNWSQRTLFRQLRETSAIQCVGRDEKTDRNIYRLQPHARQIAKEVVDGSESLLPCGHRGFSNKGDGKFECGYEGCHKVFRRRHLEGGSE